MARNMKRKLLCDTTPASGKLARTALETQIPSVLLASNAAHAKWLQNSLQACADSNRCYFIVTLIMKRGMGYASGVR